MIMHSPHCPFCNLPADRALLAISDTAFAIYDGYPVNPGHALIIPKRHVTNYFELSEEEQAACFRLLNDVKAVVQERYRPDGFNVGINVEAAAGQTVGHVHIHLIPRYWGDVENVRGGVRGVIPSKMSY